MIDRASFIYGLASGLVFAIIILSMVVHYLSKKPINLLNQIVEKLKDGGINGDRRSEPK